mgnify:CR=1 FL=1
MLTDGALRMLVLMHFHDKGYSPFTLAYIFLLYEFMGVITNFMAGIFGVVPPAAGAEQCIARWLYGGGDVDARCSWHHNDTMLMLASAHGHVEIVKVLLRHRATLSNTVFACRSRRRPAKYSSRPEL